DGQILEVSTAITGGREAKTTHFTLDVRGAAAMSFGSDATSLHGVVGEDIEPRHQIRGSDVRGGRLWIMLERQLVSAALCAQETSAANETGNGDCDEIRCTTQAKK